jgi:hypothetical protein
MAAENPNPPRTPLRAAYDRIRGLDAEAQLGECVDLLGYPDVLMNDLAEAYVLVDTCAEPPAPSADEDASEEGAISLERFAAGDHIHITGEGSTELHLLSGQLEPLPGSGPGLDYVGMLHGDDPGPVLGVVATVEESTPYSVLMRLLCCFTEMTPPTMLSYWDEHLFKGAVGAAPRFHLHLGLWSPGEMTVRGLGPAHFSLHELTRDLAALAMEACRESPPLGNYLASITCLRLDGSDWESPLEFEWSV